MRLQGACARPRLLLCPPTMTAPCDDSLRARLINHIACIMTKSEPEQKAIAAATSSPAGQEQKKARAPRKPRAKKPGVDSSKKTGRKPRKKTTQPITRHKVLLTSLEIGGLIISAITAIMVLLGYAAGRFSGTRFFASLLPFALGVLALVLAIALMLIGWMRLRRWLLAKSPFLPAILTLICALVVGVLVVRGQLYWAFGNFRTLVGGRSEASRITLTHQVFAAYRRLDINQLQKMIDRAQPFSRDIDEAARDFHLDPDLLHGIAATESSFLPRESKDGGQGLFQITRVPEVVKARASRHLGAAEAQVADHRHNGFIAAATISYYLNQMNNDLFLGLLAYNIGPANGGLRFIMQQYGATDFITVQPYLQQLPRDYPIRVLSYALAFRLFRKEGRLLAYEEGLNAVRIQHIGIPGL